jgi:HTH-type transcriptional regulator/antitoxin HigA
VTELLPEFSASAYLTDTQLSRLKWIPPEAEQLEILVTLVEAYEATHYPIDPPDPIDAITFRMEQAGLSLQDLEASLGRHAAAVLARKRPLTLAMRRRVHRGLGIAADVLLQ